MNSTRHSARFAFVLATAALCACGDDDTGGGSSSGTTSSTAANSSSSGSSSSTTGGGGTGAGSSQGGGGNGGSSETGGGGASTAEFDFTFSGSKYDQHEGEMLRVVVWNKADDTIVKTDEQMIVGASFSFTWPALLENGASYGLDYYADKNKNGSCQPPPDDHVWLETIGPIDANFTHAVEHNPNPSDNCGKLQ